MFLSDFFRILYDIKYMLRSPSEDDVVKRLLHDLCDRGHDLYDPNALAGQGFPEFYSDFHETLLLQSERGDMKDVYQLASTFVQTIPDYDPYRPFHAYPPHDVHFLDLTTGELVVNGGWWLHIQTKPPFPNVDGQMNVLRSLATSEHFRASEADFRDAIELHDLFFVRHRSLKLTFAPTEYRNVWELYNVKHECSLPLAILLMAATTPVDERPHPRMAFRVGEEFDPTRVQIAQLWFEQPM